MSARRLAPLLVALLLLAGAPPSAADASLVLAWDLSSYDVGSVPGVIADVSGAGNDMRPANMRVSDGSGIVGGGGATDPLALRFDGVDDEAWTARQLDAPQLFTLSVWFRTSRAGGQLVGFGNQQAGASGVFDRNLYLGDDGAVRFSIDAPNATLRGPAGMADDRWHHAVAIYHGTQRSAYMTLHVDGVLVDSRQTTAAPDYQGYWRIGAGPITGDGAPVSNRFGGELAALRIHDRALDAAEVGALAAAGPGGAGAWPASQPADLLRGLALHLSPATPAADGQVRDLSPLGDHGVFDNMGAAPSAIERTPELSSPSAVVLDGENDVISFPRYRLHPDAFTLSVWFRTSTSGGKLVGFESQMRGASGNLDRDLSIGRDGRVLFHVQGAQGTLMSAPGHADDRWHHAVGVIGSRGGNETMRLYVDGVLVDERDVRNEARYDGHWRLGGRSLAAGSFGEQYAGRLAGVRIYERPLTPAEVAHLHATGPDGLGHPTRLPLGEAALRDGLALRFDARDGAPDEGGRVPDLSPYGNGGMLWNTALNETSGHVAGDAPAFVFDGDNDLLVTTRHLPAPDAFSLSVSFATTGTGKLIGFESQQSGRSGSFDRELYLDDAGRLRFHVATTGGTIASERAYIDGAWHAVTAMMGSRGAPNEGMRLYVDGELVASGLASEKPIYSGYWRIGGGSTSGEGAPTHTSYQGRIGAALVHTRALDAHEAAALSGAGEFGLLAHLPEEAAAPTPEVEPQPEPETEVVSESESTPEPEPAAEDEPAAPAEPEPTAPADIGGAGVVPGAQMRDDDAQLRASSRGAHVIVEFERIAEPAFTRIVAIGGDGAEHELGTAEAPIAWTAPEGGWWAFEAREMQSDGTEVVVATVGALVLAPLGTPAQAVGAVVTGAGVVAISGMLSARGFDFLGYLKRFAFINAAERFREKTRDRFAVERWRRIGSWSSAVVALVLMALLVSAGKPGALADAPFVRALVVVGIAVLLYRAFVALAQVMLARLERVPFRYRIWSAGTLSLAVSSIAFHTPFGYTGFVQRDSPAKPRPDAKRRAAFAALATFGAMAATVLVFIVIARHTPWAFTQSGIAMAVGAIAVTSMPVKPLGGATVWAWSKPVSASVAVASFGLHYAYATGMLSVPMLTIAASIGLVAYLLALWRNRWVDANVEDEGTPAA